MLQFINYINVLNLFTSSLRLRYSGITLKTEAAGYSEILVSIYKPDGTSENTIVLTLRVVKNSNLIYLIIRPVLQSCGTDKH
jgi:hypothetical protein